MSIDIVKTLKERFSAPLPENYRRRVIFWHDPEREFEDIFDALDIDGVKPLKLTGNNNFTAKITLNDESDPGDILVYDPIVYGNIEDDWLLDAELYSETFAADLTSIRMAELGAYDSENLRKAVKSYSKFFDNKERTAKLAAFGNGYADSSRLDINIMAVLADTSDNTPSGIIRAVLKRGLNVSENAALTKIKKFGNIDAWKELLNRECGFESDDLDGEDYLKSLAAHIIITALSSSMNESALEPWKEYISVDNSQFCYSLIHEWKEGEDLEDIAREIEQYLEIPKHFNETEPPAFGEADCLPCINECIVKRYFSEISNGIIKSDEILTVIRTRSALKWYGKLKYCFDGLNGCAEMRSFMDNHANFTDAADYEDLWKSYVGELNKMDSFYRHFYTAFEKSLHEYDSDITEIYKEAADFTERYYKNVFLEPLAEMWTTLAVKDLEIKPILREIDPQSHFYDNSVKGLIAKGSRVFVIVSDALRYEVGRELYEELNSKTSGRAAIKAMSSAIPSITKFGMAALLPHSKLGLSPDMEPLCDGLKTSGLNNRQKILDAAHPGNVAIRYKDLLPMNKNEQRGLIADAQTVYIYHDVIDAAGDNPKTEDDVGKACETAISDIVQLVKRITSDMNGTNIIITADHGFLYTYEPLKEYEKLTKEIPQEYILEEGRRYIISSKDIAADSLIKIPIEKGKYFVYTPYRAIRIKQSGSGDKYVHGGITLEELAVPVIEYKHLRRSSKQYIDAEKAQVEFIGRSNKVTNSVFNLDFYQTKPASGKVTPAVYEIYMADDSGTPVSDVKRETADRTEEKPADRAFRVRLTLKNGNFDKDKTYYLTIKDKETGKIVKKTDFIINVAFINEFDF